MKVLLRKVPAEFSSSIGLVPKILLSIQSRLSNNEILKERRERMEAKEFARRAKAEDELKTLILAKIDKAFSKNDDDANGKIPKMAIVSVPSEYSEELNSILEGKEFNRYVLNIAPVIKDVRYIFEKFPILIRVTEKGGVAV